MLSSTPLTGIRLPFLEYGIGHALRYLSDLGVFPTELGIDILILATHVFAADTRISRASESQDGWTREIRLIVPVSEPDIWIDAAPIFIRMLNFLTGDKWNLLFRHRPHYATIISPRHSSALFAPQFDDIALFSGGLDSLIRAINSLEMRRKPLLISHANEGAISECSICSFQIIKKTLPREGGLSVCDFGCQYQMVWLKDLLAKILPVEGLSFLLLGIFAASGLDRQFSLKVPEKWFNSN